MKVTFLLPEGRTWCSDAGARVLCRIYQTRRRESSRVESQGARGRDAKKKNEEREANRKRTRERERERERDDTERKSERTEEPIYRVLRAA